MAQGSQDRNLPATERKLSKARDDGQVSRSEDLKHIAVLGAGSMGILVLAPVLFERLQDNMVQQLSFNATSVMQTDTMLTQLFKGTAIGLAGCSVFAAICTAAAIAASVASGGWVTSLKPITPDFSRLNPLSGFANLFSKKKMIAVAKMAFLTTILFAIAANYLSAGMQTLATLSLQPSTSAIQQLTQWTTGGLGLMLLVLFMVAIVDVPLQKLLHSGEMKMSHQEVKEEGKQSDGDPQIKARIRQKQREMANRNSINAVPKADFVVMNPTHYAVAIRYDDATMGAPQVVAKGSDLTAMRIRDIATQHAIPVLQSPMLARALYANSELNQDIPSALYTAVAQVLAYVYKLRAAMRGEGPMPGDVPAPFVPPELDPHNKSTKVVAS
jgi:flagellar biosynthetic protein FlhB